MSHRGLDGLDEDDELEDESVNDDEPRDQTLTPVLARLVLILTGRGALKHKPSLTGATGCLRSPVNQTGFFVGAEYESSTNLDSHSSSAKSSVLTETKFNQKLDAIWEKYLRRQNGLITGTASSLPKSSQAWVDNSLLRLRVVSSFKETETPAAFSLVSSSTKTSSFEKSSKSSTEKSSGFSFRLMFFSESSTLSIS